MGRLVRASLGKDERMLQSPLEVLLNVDQTSPVCSSIGNGMTCASEGLVSIFGHDTGEMTAEQARAVGNFYFALEIGVRLLHAARPVVAPTPHDLVFAMQTIAPQACKDVGNVGLIVAERESVAD